MSTVHGKARVGYTGVFLAAAQGKKQPKGQRGGKKGKPAKNKVEALDLYEPSRVGP
jgi:hypothetical protein